MSAKYICHNGWTLKISFISHCFCRDEVLLIERIEALELLGATFVDKKRDMPGAVKYWKRALELRYDNSLRINFACL